MTRVHLSIECDARIAPFRRLGVEIYVVGIYWTDVLIAHSNHMSEQGCIQWAYKQMHESKKAALVESDRAVL